MEDKKIVEYKKTCKRCKREFTSTARGTRFCCEKCQKAFAKRKKEEKARYENIKPVERLRVRSHSIAVDTVKLLAEMGLRVWECEHCGTTEGNLHVHHKDRFNWMNNTPSNLAILCEKCHTKEHSRVQKELGEQGLLVEEWYDDSMQPFHKIINK